MRLLVAFGLVLAAAPAFADQPAVSPGLSLPTQPGIGAGTISAPIDLPRLSIEPVRSRNALCGGTPQNLATGTAFQNCAFDDFGYGIAITSRQAADFGTFETYGFFARSANGAMAPWRQLSAPRFAGTTEESTLGLVGMKASLLDGRVRLTSMLGFSESWLSPVYGSPLATWRRRQQTASARMQKIELGLLERPGLTWSLSAEYASAGEDFVLGQNVMSPQMAFFMPGRRLTVSSALKLRKLRLTAASDDYSGSFGTSHSRRLGVSHGALSLAISQRSSTVAQSYLGDGLSSRTTGRGLYAEIDMPSLIPSLAFDRHGLKALVPSLVSLNLTKSRTVSVYPGVTSTVRRSGWELFGTWETRLGETSLGYLQQTKRGMAGGSGETVDRTWQATQTLRRGSWRLSLDAMLNKVASPGTGGSIDRSFYIGQTLAYSRQGGPEFSLRVGQDRNRTRMGDGSYDGSSRSTSITARLDLTDFLRRRFGRQDLQLRVEYRRRLTSDSQSYVTLDDVLERFEDARQRQGLLLSFRMNL